MSSYTDASAKQLSQGLISINGRAEDPTRHDQAITSRRDPI